MTKHAVVAALIAAVVTSGLAIAVNLATDLKDSAWAWVAVGLLTVLSAVATLRLTSSSGEPARIDLDRVAHDLAERSKDAWDRALRHRGVRRDRLIEVPWDTISVNRRLEETLLPWGGSDEDVAGVAAVLLRRRACLLVAGPAGAGKSSLARRLAIACVTQRDERDPVPILVLVPTWTLGESIPRWLERQLVAADPGLARRRSTARDLVEQHRVFPVLDGLDELPARSRAVFVEALADWLPDDAPLVVTCRADDADQPHDADDLPIDAVLVLRPIDRDEMAGVVARSSRTGCAAAWTTLLDTPHVAEALSRPLMLSLAVEGYRDRDPAELGRLPDRAAVEDRLLGAFLRTVARRRGNVPDPTVRDHSADRTSRRLTFLARHLDRLGTTDLRWWELRSAVPRGRFMIAVFVAVGLVVAAVATAWVGPGQAALMGLAGGGLAWLELDRLRPPLLPQRLGRVDLRDAARSLRPGLWRRFATGALIGASLPWPLGAATWLTWQLSPGFTRQALGGGGIFPNLLVADPIFLLVSMSTVLGVAVGGFFAFRLAEDPELLLFKENVLGRVEPLTSPNQPVELGLGAGPRHTLGQDRAWSLLLLGTAVAVPTLLVLIMTAAPANAREGFGPIGWVQDNPQSSTLLLITAYALDVCYRSEWVWFVGARAVLAIRGEMPFRFVRFLDEMESWDVLRRESDAHRFRHDLLRTWLLKQAAKDRFRTLDPRPQRLLRLLAQHPGSDFDTKLAATLAGITPARVAKDLAPARQAHLLLAGDARYQWTSGSRAAVLELADPCRDTVTARRVRDHYRDLLVPNPREEPVSGRLALRLDEQGQAALRLEVDNVLACVRDAAADGDFAYVAEVSVLVLPYLAEWNLASAGLHLLDDVLARDLPEAVELPLRLMSASFDLRSDEVDRVLALARRLGHRDHEAAALCLAATLEPGGSHLERALHLAQGTGLHATVVLAQAGAAYGADDPAAARKLYARARILALRGGGRAELAAALKGGGWCVLVLGDPRRALSYLRPALRVQAGLGATLSMASTAFAAADACWQLARYRTMEFYGGKAHRAAESIAEPTLAGAGRYAQGKAVLAQGRAMDAVTHLLEAHRYRTVKGAVVSAAVVLLDLVKALVQVGHDLAAQGKDGRWALDEARKRLIEAKDVFAEAGDTEQEEIAAQELAVLMDEVGLWA
ncbi:NACHT domain-containing protein [Umezawaea endophytica]|uniref:NACHT domain-containing protein n=1 Tax=Umezawaea endophytica TaxID=1654476 RepID=A0A9X2VVR9_9PSEU|nr:NACHT domain-containing protein [Umezawaea endophytica]MCS7483711.1 NACHT domain-containing protein [Umezawaea endophytica]